MIENFEELKNTCLSCTKCPLSKTRTNVVFGTGNPNAEVLFIGEGPGKNEDLQGEPFVGRSGILLDKLFDAIDLDRKENIYIANIVKCRPPENRDPKPLESACCIEYLRNQVYLIRPKIIVCLGRVAALNIISKDFKVTQQHGEWFVKNGVHIMGTFHPAALLRNPRNKPEAFNDMFILKEKIEEICTHTY